jgi:2-polyprenyl-3-methyl-5-hydroxy-6-metoxy-1,4-benzoquinol methylase
MSDATQLEQEAAFFDRWAEESIKKLEPIDPRVVERYQSPGKRYPKEYCIQLLGDLRGKRILDVGCGEGEDAVLLAKLGATVTGFDVSPGAIQVAQRRAEIDGVSDRVSFICAPLSEAQLPRATFDVIWFDNILHHVLDDLHFVLRKILVAAKPGADLICIEPVNLNKALRKIRFLVPVHTEVTPGERPLERHDLAIINDLVQVRRRHFLFLGRLIRFILTGYRYESATWFRRTLADLLTATDRLVLSLPRMEHLGGLAVLHGKIVI